MKYPGHVTAAVSGILLLAAVVTAGFFWNVNNRLKQTVAQPSATPLVSETPGAEPEWKTYVNGASGYEFGYPAAWPLTESEEGGSLQTPDTNAIQFYSLKDASPTIAEYLVKADKTAQTAWEGKPSVEVRSTKKTVINGLNVIQRKEYLMAADTTRTATYFKNKTIVVVVALVPTPGSATLRDEETYGHILSSFAFAKKSGATGSSQALLDTASWQTVANGKLSLKYPADQFTAVSYPSAITLKFKSTGSIGPDIELVPYDGGSRREWYNDYFSYSPGEVTFTEKELGTVPVLYAYTPGTKYEAYILGSGKLIVLVLPQGADTKTLESVISTVKFL